MPMPPPKPSTEGRDRVLRDHIRALTRAVQDLGPVDTDRLADAVGARYWEPHQFEQAVTAAVADGRVVRNSAGRLEAV